MLGLMPCTLVKNKSVPRKRGSQNSHVRTNDFAVFGVKGHSVLEIYSASDNIALAVLRTAVEIHVVLLVAKMAVAAMIPPSSPRVCAGAQRGVFATEAHGKALTGAISRVTCRR